MEKIGAKILVNSITFTRVIGTFLMPFVYKNLSPDNFIIYIVLLLLTDSIDGCLARRLKASTLFGALLDTLADKLLAFATIIVLANVYKTMWMPLILEVLITFINVNTGTKGAHIESSMLGKIKTWILGVCTVAGFITAFSNYIINLFDNTTTIGLALINIFKFIIKNDKLIMLIISVIASISCLIVAVNYLINHIKEIDKVKEDKINYRKYKLKKGNELKEALFSTDFYEKTKHSPILIRLGKLED